MDTLLILRDTITVNAVKIIDSCQPCIQGPETNLADVEIVKYICMVVVASVLIIAIALGSLAWHNYSKDTVFADMKAKIDDLDRKLEEAKTLIGNTQDEVNELGKNIKKSPELEACDLLDKISSLARPKDGITDVEIANKFFKLYKEMKDEFKGHEGSVSSES